MFKNNLYYSHFVSDLRRAVFCLYNNNDSGSKTFLIHAHSIYEKYLKRQNNRVIDSFDSLWQEMYNADIPCNGDDRRKHCEKILTLSSIIFLRIS